MSTSHPRSTSRLPAKRPPSEPPIITARDFIRNRGQTPIKAKPRRIGVYPQFLFSLPNGLALVEKRFHAFAEVLAHVAHEHEVVALAVANLRSQAQQGLLGRLQGERRVAGD